MMVTQSVEKLKQWLFWGFGFFTILSCLLAFKFDLLFLCFIPVAILVGVFTILDFKSMYFILLFTLPLSIEYYFSDSLATDLPTEPLMVGLMFLTFIFALQKRNALPGKFFVNPFILALLFHYLWIFICALNSENFFVSFKIFLSKTWYISTFTVLTAILIRTQEDLKKIFWCIYTPLTALIAITMLRHGILYGFSFQDINKCVTPYFRNHVNYAAMVSIFFPFIFLAIGWYKRGSWTRLLLILSVVFYVIAIYFSFTRTCMLAVLAMIPFYFMIKWKLTKVSLFAIIIGVLLVVFNLFHDNKYLKYAPDFEKTIYHDDFGSHLSSTFEGADVSSMERVHRWIAAVRMSQDRPFMGVGSGNFYDFYKRYTVYYFETYISDNEERSTVHNYFLLMLVEQGFIGLGIFVLLTITIFIYGEKLYYKMKTSESKRTVMILLLVMLSVYVNLLLSDMLETDKVGPFFFMTLALLVLFDTGKLSVEAESE